MKYIKTLILLIFIILLGGVNSTYGALIGEDECGDTTGNPDSVNNDSDGQKNVYWSGGSEGVRGTCQNHGYYQSYYTIGTIDSSCVASNYGDCQVSCGHSGFPISFDTGTNLVTCLKIDDIAPTAADITLTQTGGSILLANASQNTDIDVDTNSGSSIVSIQADYEVATNCSNGMTSTSSTSSPLNFNWDISEVKPNIPCDSNGQGGRDYTLEIIDVIDSAGNHLSGAPLTYTYHVYANSSLGLGTKRIPISEQFAFQSTTNYASGQSNIPLNITLLDIYNNPIITASGINRTIDFHINKNNNTLYQDQYNRIGQSAVIIHNPNGDDRFSSTGLNSVDSFTGMISLDGIYPFSFRVYAPTSNSNTGGIISDIDAEYDINDITVDITDTAGGNHLGISIDNSAINFLFNPLYQTVISGDIETAGFLEGVNQFSNIDISKNISGAPNTFNVFTKFSSGSTNGPNPDLTLTLSGSNASGFESLEDGTTVLSTAIDPYFNSTGNKIIETRLNVASGATADTITNSIFSTHIQFSLPSPFGNLTISQNSDIIGKDSYFDSLSGSTTQATGLKILGISSSTDEKVHEIITSQISNDIHILGNLDKSYLKQQIRRNALTFIKNILADKNDEDSDTFSIINDLTTDNWGVNIDGKKIYNNKILYFGDGGLGISIVSIGNIGTPEIVEGKKTIIIEGKDLYIKSDMYYGDKTKDILGIIVLSDRDGNGGNIYIDPDVTNIVGTIYADKSLISYDGMNELGGGLTQDVLKNQLHIYGSVFSENTLGGSINGICPSYITNVLNPIAFANCTSTNFVIRKNEAQKYDLNYLRRYFLNGNQPLNNGKVIGGGICNASGVCIGGNPSFMRNIIDTTTDSFASYPVVIEYNSLQQSSPPPLLSK